MEAHYSASKAGLIGLMRALSKEVGPSGIRVNAVTPGVIKTDMVSCFDEETMRALADETPLGRIGTPEDVAKAIRFLLSDEASFITGQTLGVNGGFGM
jgi:3-oxoacyl-[acyl-carrier protein] reductase